MAAWRDALSHEAEIEVWGLAPETRVRLARALARRGDLVQAAGMPGPVLERAERDEGPGGAVLAADALAELAAAAWRAALPAHLQNVLQGWWRALEAERGGAAGEPAPSADAAVAPADDWHGLTLLEREVLARIAAGDSNKLVARALDLSLHTVKRHVANILNKLDLDTRGQAAAWYRDRAL